MAWKNYFAPRIRCIFFSEGTVTNPAIWWVLGAVRIFLSLPTGTVTPTWVAESSAPSLPFLFWRRANVRNVSFLTLYGGQFTLSPQSIMQNYPVILSHRSNTSFIRNLPLYSSKKWWSEHTCTPIFGAPHEELHEGFMWANRHHAAQAKTLQPAFWAENHTD